MWVLGAEWEMASGKDWRSNVAMEWLREEMSAQEGVAGKTAR